MNAKPIARIALVRRPVRDRRTHKRAAVETHATLRSGGISRRATIRNISPGGAYLMSKWRRTPNSEAVTLTIPRAKGGPLVLQGLVRWIRRGDGRTDASVGVAVKFQR